MRTVREMLDMMNVQRDQAMQRYGQSRQSGQGWDDASYDHYHPEADLSSAGQTGRSRARDWGDGPDLGGSVVDDAAGEIGAAVISGAMGLLGRSIGKRVKRAFEERVIPAMEARAQQTQSEMTAIGERYPELRFCERDSVIFLDGGTRTVPASEIRFPITLDQADALVARLR